jgi:hypothetical protein
MRLGGIASRPVRPAARNSRKCFRSSTPARLRQDVFAVARDKGAQLQQFGKMGVTPRAVHASIGT